MKNIQFEKYAVKVLFVVLFQFPITLLGKGNDFIFWSPGDSNVLYRICESCTTETFEVNGVSFNMKCVNGGTFMMGATTEQKNDADEDEKPMHSVTLSDYCIGETEVTQALWYAVMGENPSRFKGDNHPVESVSWNDCLKFIYRLNILTGRVFRLPTEAEWEYAARSENDKYKYSGDDKIENVAYYRNNSCDEKNRHRHFVVAKKNPNSFELYDMSGNVWEWCEDWYGEYIPSSQINPTGSYRGKYHLVRGGSWSDKESDCRVSKRKKVRGANYRSCTIGLRLVLVK